MIEVQNPLACVAGDIDLLRPLGLAGIPCAVLARPGSMPRFSRHTIYALKWHDPWRYPEKVVETLIKFGSAQKEKPVLFYEFDSYLRIISRFRDQLAEVFRFVIPDAELVEDMTDKYRFQLLARRASLPVPRSMVIDSDADVSKCSAGLRFPLIVKPLTHDPDQWTSSFGLAKAVHVEGSEDLRGFRIKELPQDSPFLAQEFIPGPESSIESYHVYVDADGETAGEFTGRKIRTYPAKFGHSCSLELTDAEDVAEIGRDVIRRLNFKGVAKVDFKRDLRGGLFLFEINPRFNLWHHLGAVAGVNLPAIVYADLAGLPRPERVKARPGVRWCRIWQDLLSSREQGVPVTKWLKWINACEIKRGLSWDDPLPLIIGGAWRTFSNVSAGVSSGRFFNRLERLKQ
jgi:predicted ATP-grasp superfamily ATP-dependent carboligase